MVMIESSVEIFCRYCNRLHRADEQCHSVYYSTGTYGDKGKHHIYKDIPDSLEINTVKEN